jgi:molybdenum cofactor cytidylyltransferase
MADIAAIILAAGCSTRFAEGSDAATKLVAALGGNPLVRHVADAALLSSARPIVVVTGHQAGVVEAALRGLDLAFVANPYYAEGLSTSLRRGVDALPVTCAGALILLGDMPLVSSALIDRLIGAFERGLVASTPVPLAAAPVRAGRRGNPVLIARDLFPAIAKLEGDHGARSLIDSLGPRVVECLVEDDSALIDVDTKEALRMLEDE